MRIRFIAIAFGLWLCAAVDYYWFASQLLRLPADYAEQTSFAATTSFRDRPTGTFSTSNLTARRVDQTLVSSATHSIVQGDMHWTNDAGGVEYENTGVYGVDRDSRANLPGYGDVSRTGAFLFPLHMGRNNFEYWDPLYIGMRHATFDRVDTINGLQVYVFRFTATNLDETAGYGQLPDVPERYRVSSDGAGLMWIDPISGTLVDYEEKGVSFFVEPVTGKRVADMYHWADRYTAQTKASKLEQAKNARLRIMLLDTWMPLFLLLAGVLMFVFGLKNSRASNPELNL